MRVFMTVDMSNSNPARLKGFDLGDGLGLDFIGANTADKKPAEERVKACKEETGRWVEQRRDLSGWEDRFAIGEDNVAAGAERWHCAREFNGLVGGSRASHECGAGEQTRPMKLEDGAIDSLGLAKIVSVDDEAGHRLDANIGSIFHRQ